MKHKYITYRYACTLFSAEANKRLPSNLTKGAKRVAYYFVKGLGYFTTGE